MNKRKIHKDTIRIRTTSENDKRIGKDLRFVKSAIYFFVHLPRATHLKLPLDANDWNSGNVRRLSMNKNIRERETRKKKMKKNEHEGICRKTRKKKKLSSIKCSSF